jgi:hypothetical protein
LEKISSPENYNSMKIYDFLCDELTEPDWSFFKLISREKLEVDFQIHPLKNKREKNTGIRSTIKQPTGEKSEPPSNNNNKREKEKLRKMVVM